ncbi:MAG: hypothetical protein SPJ55_05415 [Treponema sp.]|nr:hypothetical protein [Treponema sp.]
MAVHEKNLSFAEEQKLKIAESVKNTTSLSESVIPEKKVEDNLSFKTVTIQSSVSQNSRKKDVLIGIHVTKEEQTELRQMFCSNGFSLATAYRAAMTYLRQDISDGKAVITNNGEILRK